MRVLQIDIGNTYIKWRLLVSGVVDSRGRILAKNPGLFFERLKDIAEVDAIPISSVASSDFNSLISEKLLEIFGRDPWFCTSTDKLIGVTNAYLDSSELGVDRWLAIVAAWAEFQRDVIIVDSGTALTIDIVDQKGSHLGGYIIPGGTSMERALLSDAANLSCNYFSAEHEVRPGNNTAQAIKNGIALAQVGAVYSILDKFQNDFIDKGNPAVVFCGGGGELLRDLCKLESFWRPDLVFEGLEIATRELL